MEKLRIHRTKYRNKGTANKKLRGQQEHHVIFKFDTEEAAKGFTKSVKDWWYSIPPNEVKTPLLQGITNKETTKALNDALNKFNDETPETPEATKPARKKPGPQKGKGGRPSQKNIQR